VPDGRAVFLGGDAVTLSKIIDLVVPVVLALAAMAKMLDWRLYVESLDSFILIPPGVARIAAFVVPGTECLPLVLALLGKRIVGNALAFVLVGLFTSILVVHWLNNVRPECACLGAWSRYHDVQSAVSAQLVRNLLMMLLCAAAIVARVRRGLKDKVDVTSALPYARGASRNHGGFSIVETLAVIAIIAMVLVIALPTISGVMRRGRETGSVANLRTHAQILALYANDHDDALPRPFGIGEPITTYTLDGGWNIPVRYFDTHRYWHLPLAEPYYNTVPSDPVFIPPAIEGEQYQAFGVETPYAYSCSNIAAPEYWDIYTRTDLSQWVTQRLDHVAHPTAKSLVVQLWPQAIGHSPSQPDARVPVATFDGSAVVSRAHQRFAGYPRGDGPEMQPFGSVHFGDYPPMLHTVHGVRGRDLKR
jgi:type II secretory pathway pseudopilin PulG